MSDLPPLLVIDHQADDRELLRLVLRGGRVAIAVEGRGRRYTVADWLSPEEVQAAKKALLEHLRGERSARYVM